MAIRIKFLNSNPDKCHAAPAHVAEDDGVNELHDRLDDAVDATPDALRMQVQSPPDYEYQLLELDDNVTESPDRQSNIKRSLNGPVGNVMQDTVQIDILIVNFQAR